MNHPFAMQLSELTDLDLNFETPLTQEESSQVGGGLSLVTRAWNEGGGGCGTLLPICELPVHLPRCPVPVNPAPCPVPVDPTPCPRPPMVTTMALGEEGGTCHPWL